MRLAPRRLTLQLTSLLDLLLIVIFAQYMEVREQTKEVQTVATQRQERLETVEENLSTLRARHAAAAAALEAERQRLAEIAERNEQLQETAERLREQRDTVGELAAELFRVPPDLAEQALLPGGRSVSTLSSEELEQVRQRFRELAQMRGTEIVEHLLTYNELRKRADVWDIHIAENGLFKLGTGERTAQFRAETPEQFAARLFDAYKDLPQPKGLVVILLSWGDARAVWRQAALQGLPLATMRMRDDSGGRTRFEYAVLGYRPRGNTKS